MPVSAEGGVEKASHVETGCGDSSVAVRASGHVLKRGNPVSQALGLE